MNQNALPGSKKPPKTVALPYWLREFSMIRGAVLSFAGVAALCTAGVLASHWWQQDANDHLDQVQKTRDAAYSHFAQVDSEIQDIRNFQPQFITLVKRGLVGQENRLEWIDAIRRVQTARQLLPLSYDMEPQQTFSVDSNVELGDYQLRGSRMSLHMDLLHEMDLFNFLDDLHRRGYFALQDCALKRLPLAVNQPGAATLGADCTLNWLSLTPTGATELAQIQQAQAMTVAPRREPVQPAISAAGQAAPAQSAPADPPQAAAPATSVAAPATTSKPATQPADPIDMRRKGD